MKAIVPLEEALEPTSEVISILEEFLTKLEAGARLNPEDLTARCPALADPLKGCLASLEFLHEASLSLRDPAAHELLEATGCQTDLGPLGDFQLLREIGRGGMGVVYEAQQISLGRRVALKVLPFAAALDARQLQRFKNEAQAAAWLHHTNIVPVFGVGCERGVHYYAMQYIEGQTLAAIIKSLRHGNDCGLPGFISEPSNGHATAPSQATEASAAAPAHVRAAAVLGMQAAQALEHAHQLGVVHRDIKPANLLVESAPANVSGGNGHAESGVRLWVTDFGLAHCRQGQAGLTATGDLVGTLRYMSPEQAGAQPIGVDHRTDLYSLGATLYEFLTLEPAFNGDDRHELLRQIAIEEPRPVRKVNKAVPADLETIVLKAMAKNPLERYATAQEMANDLGRFLRDEPILARPLTLLKRTRRWARRHRGVMLSAAVASLAALTVLAGSIGWIMRDRAARRAELTADLQSAVDELQRLQKEGKLRQAQAAAARAQALIRVGAADPAVAERARSVLREQADEQADVTLLESLDAIRLRQADVEDNHFVVSHSRKEYERAFRTYGLHTNAMAPEEAARTLSRPPRRVRAILLAALVHWSILASHENAPAAAWLKQVLALADADPWRQGVRLAREKNDLQAMEKLAREVDTAVQPPEALFVLEMGLSQRGSSAAALALLRRAQQAFPADFWINHNLGYALGQCVPPQHEEHIRFLTVAVALRPDSPGVRLNLGNALAFAGRLNEAEVAYRQAIGLKPDYAIAHYKLSQVLWEHGQLDEAIAACRRAIELKPDHARARYSLGVALADKGQLDEAIACYKKAIALDPKLAAAQNNLGLLLKDSGQWEEAVACYKKAIELDPKLARAHYNLGLALADKGQLPEAIASYRKAIALNPKDAMAHDSLGHALLDKGEVDEAIAWYKKAIALDPKDAKARNNLGVALKVNGQWEEAIACYQKAIELDPKLAKAHYNLGLALADKGQLPEAIASFKKAIALNPKHAMAHYDLGNVLVGKAQVDEAIAWYKKAIALDPKHAEAHCNLGQAFRTQGRFAEALAAVQRGHELGTKRPGWPYPSAEWVRQAENMAAMESKLPAFRRGEFQPKDATERLGLAGVCQAKKLHSAAMQLYAEAFAADAKLADDLKAGHRYDAACFAARAAAGQVENPAKLDDKERTRLRQQALDWLRADLALRRKQLETGKPADRAVVHQALRHWQKDTDLAGIRDVAVLAKLPAEECAACERLWADVAALVKKVDERAGQE
jgi:eukaryotic-like serine/threonine-protein kinase